MTSKSAARLLAAVLGLAAPLAYAEPTPDVWARTVIHQDGSRTESKRDAASRVVEAFTYDPDDRLLMKRIYQLDARGRSQRGFIFDGQNRMIYKITYVYDEIDRLKEEILFTMSGAVARRKIHDYDSQGRPLPPVAVDYGSGLPEANAVAIQPDVALSDPRSSEAAPTGMPTPRSPAAKTTKKRRFLFFKRREKE